MQAGVRVLVYRRVEKADKINERSDLGQTRAVT